MNLVERHLNLASQYLGDAAATSLSAHGRATATWNAGLQIALAKLTAEGKRPSEHEWEDIAEQFLRLRDDAAVNALAQWSHDRFFNPLPSSRVLEKARTAIARLALGTTGFDRMADDDVT